jgi:AraC-like DNA-binding protein
VAGRSSAAAVRAARDWYNRAIARRDANAIAALFTPDYHAVFGRGAHIEGVEAARAALEGGLPSVQRIAQDCGFGSTERMRRSFQRLLGRAPAAFRKVRHQAAAAPALASRPLITSEA